MQTDYCKAHIKSDSDYQFPNNLDFEVRCNNSTGEMRDGQTAEYRQLKLLRYGSGRKVILGSIHKFHNKCDFNGNDFNLFQLLDAQKKICSELDIHPKDIVLENLELNLTIALPFAPEKVINNLLFHGSKNFTQPLSHGFYRQCEKNEYIIKIYDKTEQYKHKLKSVDRELNSGFLSGYERKEKTYLQKCITRDLRENLLRFEIKFRRMGRLNKLGIVTLYDLLNANIYERLLQIFLNCYDEVYFYDFTTDHTEMNYDENYLMKDFRNPNYWLSIDRKKRYDKKKRFAQLTCEYSKNIKEQIREMFILKYSELVDEYIDFFGRNYQSDFRLFERSNIGSFCPSENA